MSAFEAFLTQLFDLLSSALLVVAALVAGVLIVYLFFRIGALAVLRSVDNWREDNAKKRKNDSKG